MLRRAENSFEKGISSAFSSYFDNLVFRHNFGSTPDGDVEELPSIKNRFKVSVGLIEYAKSSNIFDELQEGPNSNISKKQRIKGARNYLKLIQLALSILYSSRIALEKINELKAINNKSYWYTKEHFDCFFDPIKEAVDETDTKPNKKMLDLMLDWVNKMLKYQQRFNPDNSGVFEHCLESLVSIMATRSEKLDLTWSVIQQLIVIRKAHHVALLTPKFLKDFNDDMQATPRGSQRVRDAYRAIKTLRFAEISAEITRSMELEDLVDKQAQKLGIDTESTAYKQDIDTSWIQSFINKFTRKWNKYIGTKSGVDLEDIKLQDGEGSASIDSPDPYENMDNVKPTQSLLLKTLIGRMENTGTQSRFESQLSNTSHMITSKFSLDEAIKSSRDNLESSESEQSLIGYVKNMKDYTYTIEESNEPS